MAGRIPAGYYTASFDPVVYVVGSRDGKHMMDIVQRMGVEGLESRTVVDDDSWAVTPGLNGDVYRDGQKRWDGTGRAGHRKKVRCRGRFAGRKTHSEHNRMAGEMLRFLHSLLPTSELGRRRISMLQQSSRCWSIAGLLIPVGVVEEGEDHHQIWLAERPTDPWTYVPSVRAIAHARGLLVRLHHPPDLARSGSATERPRVGGC